MSAIPGLTKYDPSSVEAAVICVVFFWALITICSLLTRHLLLHLSNVQDAITARPYPDPAPGTWFSNHLIHRIQLNRALILALLDSVATFELCACSLECWIIRAAIGQTGLLIAIALNGLRGFVFTCRDAYGNPCTPFYRYLKGRTNALWVGITWCMQLTAAWFALRVAQIWWSLHLTTYHATRHDLALKISEMRFASSGLVKPNNFPSDLQVSTWLGFVIETTGVCVDFILATIFSHLIGRWNERRRNPVLYSATEAVSTLNGSANNEQRPSLTPSKLQFWSSFAFRFAISLFLTAKCIGLTGLYVNPANAFIQSWGLGDVSSYSHLCVYWLGPLFGVWLSVQFERWFVVFMTERPNPPIPLVNKVRCLISTATQTAQECHNLGESSSSTQTNRRGLSTSRWSTNALFRSVLSPFFDSRISGRDGSNSGRSNGLGTVSRFTRYIDQPGDVVH